MTEFYTIFNDYIHYILLCVCSLYYFFCSMEIDVAVDVKGAAVLSHGGPSDDAIIALGKKAIGWTTGGHCTSCSSKPRCCAARPAGHSCGSST